MANTDLLFELLPRSGSPVELVFGEEAPPPAVADTRVSGTAVFTRPTASGRTRLGIRASASATFVRPTLQATTRYDSDTQRPLVGETQTRFQRAGAQPAAVAAPFEEGRFTPAQTAALFAKAVPVDQEAAERFVDSQRLRLGAASAFQEGQRNATGYQGEFIDSLRTRIGFASGFQEGIDLAALATNLFQDADRRSRQTLSARMQEATPLQGALRSLEGHGGRLWARVETGRYQEAMRPRPGRSWYPPEPEEPPGSTCYTPDPDLLFSLPFPEGDAGLLFECDNAAPPPPVDPETVIVPVRRVYIVINDTTIRRVSDNAVIPCLSASLSLDAESWTWGLSASLPAQALGQVLPTDGENTAIKVMVNGTEFRFVVESVEREWTFGQRAVKISGRGMNAYLDASYAPQMSFSNPFARTANQLMEDVLTVNGIPLGWNIDWQLEDWNVPANVFTHQGTYISALAAIANAAGGFILPHPSAQSMTIKHRYPVKPWELNTTAPDFVLPAAVTTSEALRWVDKPKYNRVFVSGQQQGIERRVTRAGTAGELLAPGVVDPLITDDPAARQRGLAILGDTGRQVSVGLRLPVLPETGILRPGHIVRYEEGSTLRTGIVRSVNVEVQHPTVFQSLEVETHE